MLRLHHEKENVIQLINPGGVQADSLTLRSRDMPKGILQKINSRRTGVFSLDAGLVEYFYDTSGNLVKKIDDNLRADETEILYEYDGLNRLVKTDYPYMTDVVNIYGNPGNGDNSAGRLVKRIDESGSANYTYGKMGETTRMHVRAASEARDQHGIG